MWRDKGKCAGEYIIGSQLNGDLSKKSEINEWGFALKMYLHEWGFALYSV